MFDFELSDKESRKRAFRELRRVLEKELLNGPLPYFCVVYANRYGEVSNHYMTPIALREVDGKYFISIFDYEFFLKLFCRHPKVSNIRWDAEERCIVVFMTE